MIPFIAFFAVIPFESSSLLLYKNSRIPSLFILGLQFFTLMYGLYLIFIKKAFDKSQKKILIRYTLYFVFIGCLNAWAQFFSASTYDFALVKLIATRSMSMVCIWGFLVCCLHFTKKGTIYFGLGNIGAFMIIFSCVMFVLARSNTMMQVNATEKVFKGVAGNRNSYFIYLFTFFAGAIVMMNERIFHKFNGNLRNLKRDGIVGNILTEKKNYRYLVPFLAISAIGVISMLFTKSATGLMLLGLGMVIICVYIFRNSKFPIWIVPAAYGLIWLVIGVIGIDKIIPEAVFQNVFHRSISLSSRTLLWEKTKSISVYSLITGFGFDSSYLADMHVVSAGNTYINDPHNSLLYLILTQGLLGLFATLYMMVKPLIKAVKVNDNKRITFLLIFISIMIFRGLVESVFQYTDMILWSLFIAVECEADMSLSKEKNIENIGIERING